ncbi:Phosphoenolpyruvate carboxylase [Mannheimia haemolytica]|uniref:Phosphoenolpyruvate carboxylase n=1 Tax=Mannheimia haemolytica TaxID=75985 RepID=A0A378N750_MANHA|nr:Phosphoenolpyruvate carboxylase [Mannheimia haemolytica]
MLDTCKIVAEQPEGVISAYVISMAERPLMYSRFTFYSKRRGANLLFGCPLFETLGDLDHSEKVMNDLFNIGWYRGVHQQFTNDYDRLL